MGRQTSILSCCGLRMLLLQRRLLQIFQVGSGPTRAVTGKPAFRGSCLAVNVQCIYLRVRTCDCEQIQSVSEYCEAHSVSQHLCPVSSSLCTCCSVFYLVIWCQIVSNSCGLKFWPLLPAVTCRVLGLPVFHLEWRLWQLPTATCCLADSHSVISKRPLLRSHTVPLPC